MAGNTSIFAFSTHLAFAIGLSLQIGCSEEELSPGEPSAGARIQVAPPNAHVGEQDKEFLRIQAEAALPGKQYKYAYILSINPQDPTDLVLAKDYYTKEAEKGHLEACYRLGVMLSQGTLDGKPDIPAAVKWLERAAQDGHSGAQYLLGRLSLQDKDVETNLEKAVSWLQLAAHQSHPGARYLLARLYETGHGIGPDLGEAFKWYMLAARSGNPAAQFKVGKMYQEGVGITKDESAARQWLAQAANMGILIDPPLPNKARPQESLVGARTGEVDIATKVSENTEEKSGEVLGQPEVVSHLETTDPNLGQLSQNQTAGQGLDGSSGVAGDDEGAAEPFIGPPQLGADQFPPDGSEGTNNSNHPTLDSTNGNPQNQSEVATAPDPSSIVVEDAPPQTLHRKALDLLQPPATQEPQPVAAVAYLQKAAYKGYTPSQLGLADAYYEGTLDKPDYKQAFLWYNLAANSQNPTAQYRLGSMYLEGKGVEKNVGKAREWLGLSAKQGYNKAIELLDSIPTGEVVHHQQELPSASSTAQPSPAPSMANQHSSVASPVKLLTPEEWLQKGIDIYASGNDDLSTEQYRQAYQYFVRAAKAKHQDAWYYIGRMLDYGHGFPVSPDKAFQYYKVSAVGGNLRAQYNLGYFYETGQGCKVNPIESYAWYALAAENGDGNAAQIRLELESSMTSSQHNQAKQRLSVVKDYVIRYQQLVPPK